MTVSLLSTKLHIPRPRGNGVSRPRLTEKFFASVQRPGSFVLLSGPAGFGKTTLLSEFVSELPHPVAWVTLDEGDNDPIRFWTYLIRACQSVRSGMGESALSLLQISPSAPDATVPTLLINDIASRQDGLVLILDDFHTIQNPSIHSALFFLLDYLPDNLHLIVSTRADPPWPMARFRARNQLEEIRAADLRFTTEEITAFLNKAMGLRLSAEDVTAIEARTEGWIASLQLAALSMKGHSDVSRFIKAFTGSHVFVADYLVEEVLSHQPEAVQTFLLRTSILESLNASLCDAVSGRADSQAMLKDLFQANLFILPLDQEGKWFRYHQLFADLLRARLQQTVSAAEFADLHQRAAVWYEQAEMINEAIVHALACGDYEYALRLVENSALPMILKAHFKTVEHWLQAIPSKYIRESIPTNLALAWMYIMRRDMVRAAPLLERLGEMFSRPQAPQIKPALQGEWLALQSMLLGGQGKSVESRDLAEQALRLLPEDESQIRSMTYMGLANAHQQLFDYERAAEAMQAIIENARAAGDLASEVFGLSLLGRMIVQQGGLHSAYAIVSQALERMESTGASSPFSATLYGELAEVHYHWHQLEEAREYFSRSVKWSTLGGFSDAEIYHHVFLSRLFQMEGDLQASVQEIEKALHLMETAAPALVGEEVVAQQVHIFLALDRLAAAQIALKPYGFTFDEKFSCPELEPEAGLSHAMGLLYNSALRIILYRVKIKRERHDLNRVIELTDRIMQGAQRCRQLPIVLQTLLLQAQLHIANGDDQTGLRNVAHALQLAEREKFISLFVVEGLPVADALKALLARNLLQTVSPDYIQEILAAFPNTQPHKLAPGKQPAANPPVKREDAFLAPIEPLTPREMEVLKRISAGESNQMIADKLVITLSAVKKHTGNIFGKLNVNSRTQAIVRANQLGLLSSD